MSGTQRNGFRGTRNGQSGPAAIRRGKRADLPPDGKRKAPTLQGALLEHGPEPAMILVILALMGASGTVRIRRSRLDGFGRPASCPAVQAVFAKYRRRFAGCLDGPASGRGPPRLRYWEEGCQARAFKVLCDMDRREVHELFTAMVASNLADAAGREPAPGDTPLAVALARELGAGPT
jgi:hypothetical protein